MLQLVEIVEANQPRLARIVVGAERNALAALVDDRRPLHGGFAVEPVGGDGEIVGDGDSPLGVEAEEGELVAGLDTGGDSIAVGSG